MLTQEQLEWIVSEVVRRLRAAGHAAPPVATVDPPTERRLVVTERLVTVGTLRDRLDGIDTLEVPPRAIVTPAVIDLLKDRQIALARQARPTLPLPPTFS